MSLPDEISHLITAFLPSQSPTTRSKAYLTLSAFCQGVRSSSSVKGKQPDPATEALANAFTPSVVSQITHTEEDAVLAGASFLTALFQVDWEAAVVIFGQDGFLEAIMDNVELTPSTQLTRGITHLLAQACGHKACRTILSPHSIQWLESLSRTSTDTTLRASATNALIKLLKGSAIDNTEAGVEAGRVEAGNERSEHLANTMREVLMSNSEATSTSDAVEGLAHLSVDPTIKEALSCDTIFLLQLFELIPSRQAISSIEPEEPTAALTYGILVIISNLCAYRPHLTEEQEQIEKIRGMAKVASASKNGFSTSVLNDDEHVKVRVRRLLDARVLDVFAAAVRADSAGTRLTIGKILLSIVEDKENRGKVLQNGGAKILAHIIKQASSYSPRPSRQSADIDPAYLESIQALAKLAITSSPVQVFGPNEGAMYDAIRPFSFMLQSPSSTPLQRFESMMALTNLSSQTPETASRIARSVGLMNKIELLLLEEHILIRRAAMELLCNLIAGSEEVFEKYGGGDSPTNTRSKLQIVLALCDVDDLPTRLAASGALATLTTAPSACQGLVILQQERQRVFHNLTQLIDPSVTPVDEPDEKAGDDGSHPGLIHRAIVCTQNIFSNIEDAGLRKRLSKEAEEAGLLRALVSVVKGQIGGVDDTIVRLAAETLKIWVDSKS